ncbi:uncharacterized protein CIMG_11670 [Coccidioides immitis RS]|uniref:Uncharacterized protein n=1 Tax=Coccidioides immitis (strain RS) TaxID=246410 RepID=A0A0D8JU71_COCIM|nr:uncharacterized protein CIMG_11670 [Coccidioides immitis RS]KJF60511.1 hypothetical protein CIMG_11670 [Coccidioides immitis RS]
MQELDVLITQPFWKGLFLAKSGKPCDVHTVDLVNELCDLGTYISKKEDKCFVSKLRGISIPFTVPFEASKAASLVSSAQAGQPMLSRDLRALVWTLGWRSYTSRTSNHRSLARNTAKPNADW